jgi:predicted GIY-YIG superfamily endonuclease
LTNKLKKYETTIFNRTTDICPIEYHGKDVVYFFKFEVPIYLHSKYISEYPTIDNQEYSCIEFGVSSNIEERIKGHKGDKKKEGLVLIHAIELDKRYTASKMESYIKTLARQMNIKFNYEKKLECIIVNEDEFNMLINKINKGLNGLEECDAEIKEDESYISYSVEVELRKLDIQVEMKRIDSEKDKSMSKIESITELFKNKIISFEEYKEMMMMF